MIKHTHVIKTCRRTTTVTIEERPDKVVVCVKPSFTGEFARGEHGELSRAMFPLLLPYEDDPRPVEMANPRWGEVASINGMDGIPYALITTEPRQ